MIRIDEIRKEMASGYAVHVERQSGKTTAVMHDVHEKHHGEAIVVVLNSIEVSHFSKRYCALYSDDPKPCVVSFENAKQSIYGNSLPIYIDEWWRIPDEIQAVLLNTGRIAGAVGTMMSVTPVPLC